MTDDIEREARRAWELSPHARKTTTPISATLRAVWEDGYRARAAEQAKPDVVACGKSYGNLSLRCRRPAKHRGKCSASDGVELVAVQLAEARAGVKHLMELERQGENIEGLHSIVLRADAHQADSSGSAAGGKGGSAARLAALTELGKRIGGE